MAVQFEHFKRYKNFYGVDYKSNDLEYPEEYATDILNVSMRKNGTIEKRKGFQGHATSAGGIGLFSYQRNNPSTGSEESIVLSIDNALKKLEADTLSISYSGSEASAIVNIGYDTVTSAYVLSVAIGTDAVWTQSLGIAVDNPTPYTLSQLVTAINAYGHGLSASNSGPGTVPAPFLHTTVDYDIVSLGTLTVDAQYWSTVSGPVASPFSAAYAQRNSSNFENVSSTQLQNCIYFASGYTEVFKYDGQKVYRAGVPSPELNQPFTSSGAGTDYEYAIRFIHGDAVYNVAEGNLTYSNTVKNTFPAAVTVSVKNLAASSGFNATGAIISTGATGVSTIPVTAGHTLISGDIIYFWDALSGSFVNRTITSTTLTSVSFSASEGLVNVINTGTDNKNVISNNLKIAIYRNVLGGGLAGLFYEVVQIPNNPFAANSTWSDTVADATLELNAELTIPLTDRSPPQKGRYISSFQNLLVTAGDLSNPNVCSFSDIENPEYFPIPDNQITISNLIGDQITGIAPSLSLIHI